MMEFPIEHQVIIRDEMKVIGVELKTTNANGKAMQDIPAFWAHHLEQKTLEQIPDSIDPSTVLAVYTDYENGAQGAYSLILCKEVKGFDFVPRSMVARVIPGAKYAVVKAKGPFPQALQQAWGFIWSPTFPYKRLYTYDFELYDARFHQVTPEVEVYVAIQ